MSADPDPSSGNNDAAAAPRSSPSTEELGDEVDEEFLRGDHEVIEDVDDFDADAIAKVSDAHLYFCVKPFSPAPCLPSSA